ncbi:MAG: LacI family DNA-binding transcriptional regulator [Chloroflexota bacterium]|nr:LacI family DNA-binding transcriptional regulator [Chloroflexota bacterium]
MAVTIRDIAAELDLSISAVSKALNDYPDIAPETRQLVKETARRMGYQPSAAARSLRTRKTNTIGLIFCIIDRHLTDPYYLNLLASIGEESSRLGFDLLISACPDRGLECSAYERITGGKKVDGMILTGIRYEDERITYLVEQAVPFVSFGRSEQDGEFPYIDVDGGKGAEDSVQHLIDQGYKHISFIGLPTELICAGHRFQGYKSALERNGVDFDPNQVINCERLTQDSGYQVMHQLLDLDEPPDAACICSDALAIGAMRAVQDKGLNVGSDFGIVGFDDIPMASQVQPPLTSIRQPIYEVGTRLCQMLIEQIQGKHSTEQHIILEPTLVVRESSGFRQ